MAVIQTKQAQKIVSQIMRDIPYNINIINNEGLIIASGDTTRVGDFHKSGQRAVKRQQTVLVYEDTQSERQGANEPIIIDGQIVGVIGISGNPEEVKSYTKLLSSMVKLMLEQEQETISQFQADKRRDDFIATIMTITEGDYPSELVDEGMALFQLDIRQQMVVLVSTDRQNIAAVARASQRPIFKYQHYFLLLVEDDKFEAQQFEKQIDSQVFMDKVDNIADGVNHIFQTMTYLDLFNRPTTGLVQVRDYAYYLFNDAFITIETALYLKVSQLEDSLKQTLLVYTKHSTRVKDTTEELHLHRNTLNYRLDKVYEMTTLDPKRLTDLFVLVTYIAHFYKYG